MEPAIKCPNDQNGTGSATGGAVDSCLFIWLSLLLMRSTAPTGLTAACKKRTTRWSVLAVLSLGSFLVLLLVTAMQSMDAVVDYSAYSSPSTSQSTTFHYYRTILQPIFGSLYDDQSDTADALETISSTYPATPALTRTPPPPPDFRQYLRHAPAASDHHGSRPLAAAPAAAAATSPFDTTSESSADDTHNTPDSPSAPPSNSATATDADDDADDGNPAKDDDEEEEEEEENPYLVKTVSVGGAAVRCSLYSSATNRMRALQYAPLVLVWECLGKLDVGVGDGRDQPPPPLMVLVSKVEDEDDEMSSISETDDTNVVDSATEQQPPQPQPQHAAGSQPNKKSPQSPTPTSPPLEFALRMERIASRSDYYYYVWDSWSPQETGTYRLLFTDDRFLLTDDAQGSAVELYEELAVLPLCSDYRPQPLDLLPSLQPSLLPSLSQKRQQKQQQKQQQQQQQQDETPLGHWRSVPYYSTVDRKQGYRNQWCSGTCLYGGGFFEEPAVNRELLRNTTLVFMGNSHIRNLFRCATELLSLGASARDPDTCNHRNASESIHCLSCRNLLPVHRHDYEYRVEDLSMSLFDYWTLLWDAGDAVRKECRATTFLAGESEMECITERISRNVPYTGHRIGIDFLYGEVFPRMMRDPHMYLVFNVYFEYNTLDYVDRLIESIQQYRAFGIPDRVVLIVDFKAGDRYQVIVDRFRAAGVRVSGSSGGGSSEGGGASGGGGGSSSEGIKVVDLRRVFARYQQDVTAGNIHEDVDGPAVFHDHLFVPAQKLLIEHVLSVVAMEEVRQRGGRREGGQGGASGTSGGLSLEPMFC